MNFGNELALAIGKAATILPPDVVRALEAARDREAGPARVQLEAILENVRIAREGMVPICQDTGTITFFVRLGMGFPHLPALVGALPEAARLATKAVPLRPNTVHPFTGKNPGDNTGRYIPAVTWEMTDGDGAEIHILPKGGGSENCCALKMLAPGVGLKGVKEAVVEHVVGCGGLPCPPTVVGVGIGGGADLALKLGKTALLRPLGQRHPEPEVAALEAELEDLINASGVGPMGLGGKTTVLAVHAEYAHRHPASLPVGIVTQCWAHRRATVRVRADGRMEVA
ncbi:MAG TPA: fumarate hydratase [Candidatus Bipolaricaulis anaerobius]|uniref:fumarate hydratase n=1 Tax=Candidatus Bipolaricaulis anaerobius TaxID=2026885 RepID=UPI000EFD0D83|nr:fumarate hydratase [Candidatus Bipolaricaulis anaerobius]MBP7726185.1 fumarate hydratase [Candidatus Bipolaricaulis sp.]HNR24893.1 fumarate hydratase [Candidatus Bipolaricaulis anaerobius]HNS24246.1 fumarate hydratase [Candidatus Bipolaricaulis anaerobius]